MIANYFFVIPLLAAIGNLALCVLVLRRDSRSPVNRSFALATAAMVLWNLNFFAYSAFDDKSTAFFWSRLFRSGTLLMPPTALHFFFVFAGRSPKFIRPLLTLAYCTSAALVGANAFDLLVVDLMRTPWGFYFVPAQIYRIFSLEFFACAALMFFLLGREAAYSQSSRRRLQARMWLVGTLVAVPFGLTHLVLQPTVHLPPLGNIANSLYVAIIAYGIVRYRLLDIDLVMARGLAYAAVVSCLAAPTLLAVSLLQELTFGRIDNAFTLAILVISSAGWFFFPPLRQRIEHTIELSLLKRKHEYRSELASFSRAVLRIIDRERLCTELVNTLSRALNLELVSLALTRTNSRTVDISNSVGSPPPESSFSVAHPLVTVLSQRTETIQIEQLDDGSTEHHATAAAATMHRNGWQLCVPLVSSGRLVGLIGLGSKSNRAAFTVEDLELLETVAAETAVALENIRLIEELNRSRDLIQRADRSSSLGVLAAGIAHEIRNPLVAIQTFFQLAPERIYDEEFVTSFLETSSNEVRRISALITELLSFARSPLKAFGPVDLRDILDGIVVLLGPEARRRQVSLVISKDPWIPAIRGNAEQIRQALINLVFNALQATPPGGSVSISVTPIDGHSKQLGMVHVQVSDTGCGISDSDVASIFDPFFTTKDKGTGLGLAIVQQIAMEHGGHVKVKSQIGQGSAFTLALPVEAPEAAEATMNTIRA